MNKLIQYIITGFFILTLAGCEKFLEPNVVDGKIDEELIWDTRALAEGVLLRAYQTLPSYYATSAYSLDIPAGDAVTNVLTSSVHRMSNGGWTTRYNPINIYESTYDALMQINDFLEHVDMVQWADTSKPMQDSILRVRLKGEAYGLRAFYNARLLQRIGGVAENGELLGFPIVTEVIDDPSQAQLARNTYARCVQQIFDDCNAAIALLPKTWTDENLSVEEAKVMGAKYANRINGLSVMLIKARTALMAASEAYSQSGVTMETAAEFAADIINFQGGIANVATDPLQFWLQNEAYLTSYNEIFWHTGVGKTNGREKSAYPPSLFGNGQLNPSQNLVDAFPDSDGYPITQSSTYDPQKPYANRDPRLAAFIVLDSSTIGSSMILTGDGASEDGLEASFKATRTGYYLRKLLNEGVILTPNAIVRANAYYTFARYTEALLIYAEAANAVGGPDNDLTTVGVTPRSVINAIRARAGISDATYANSLNQQQFASLVKNERRLELCFEEFRLFDLMRWNELDNVDANVTGMNISTTGSYNVFNVEQRSYQEHQNYGPLPYYEVLKYDALIQNQGW